MTEAEILEKVNEIRERHDCPKINASTADWIRYAARLTRALVEAERPSQAMLDAGSDVLLGYDSGYDPITETVTAIWEAMELIRQQARLGKQRGS